MLIYLFPTYALLEETCSVGTHNVAGSSIGHPAIMHMENTQLISVYYHT